MFEAYVVSKSCWDFDILLVSSLKIFGSAEEKALQGLKIFGHSALRRQKGQFDKG